MVKTYSIQATKLVLYYFDYIIFILNHLQINYIIILYHKLYQGVSQKVTMYDGGGGRGSDVIYAQPPTYCQPSAISCHQASNICYQTRWEQMKLMR